jgi:23S rRNA pseudouridine1911/1915/1917 synthase
MTASRRLDQWLVATYPNYSRSYFQRLIEKGCVLINGRACKKRELLCEEDEVEVCFELPPEISLEPEAIPLDVLYEDSHLLVVNKPAGMVVHPAPGHPSKTFVNALLHHCRIENAHPVRPGIVHRLDKDTSGLLIAAKTYEAHQKLVALFSERRVEKSYLALCVGNPGERTIRAPLGRHPTRRKERAVCLERGKEAVSHCQTLDHKEGVSLVQVRIVTGRTHQVRVHMKHCGAPVLGDPLYGSPSANRAFGADRQLLHAYQIRFTHPCTGDALHLCAPPPQDMVRFIKTLKLKEL